MTTPERERAELQSAVRRLRRALLAINRVIDQGSAACLRCEDDREAIRELALVALEKTAAVRKQASPGRTWGDGQVKKLSQDTASNAGDEE